MRECGERFSPTRRYRSTELVMQKVSDSLKVRCAESLVDVAQYVKLDFYVLQSAYAWARSHVFCNAGDFEAGITPNFNSVAVHGRMASSYFFLSHNTVRELNEVLWDQMRGIIDVVEKRLQAETRRVMLDAMIRALMMITVFMLTLIALLCLLPLQVSLDDRH